VLREKNGGGGNSTLICAGGWVRARGGRRGGSGTAVRGDEMHPRHLTREAATDGWVPRCTLPLLNYSTIFKLI
jgi:hypothetical protein